MAEGIPRAIRLAILAMGGEGGGVLADWVVDLAEHEGYLAQATSVPGVAQRTGATIYYLELFPKHAMEGRDPVLALMPVPGDVDIVIASELMEAARAVERGLVTADRTVLIASTNRVYAMTEKIALGDGRTDTKPLGEAIRLAAHRLVATDMAKLAERTGSVLSAVMFGALAGSGALPFERAAFEATIDRAGIGVEASKRGFAAGFDAAMRGDTQPEEASAPGLPDMPVPEALAPFVQRLPLPAQGIARLGIARLIDYQDEVYARAYLDRVLAVAEIDMAHGDGSSRLTAEVARELALGMAYEDTIRVAELKIRPARLSRVGIEVAVKDGEILKVAEFLHPRLEEIVESVPRGLGRFLERNALARRVVEGLTRKGRIVETTSIRGFLLLAAVARLKTRRRRSRRYEEEQAFVTGWLGAIRQTAVRDYDLAVALAECRTLVKGYGDTHARGRRSYDRIMGALPKLVGRAGAAERLVALREAALADETGAKLDAELVVLDQG
ncbi:MAG: indolepyruvate oxidoreductase subunit beta family protein [Hyphomicrobiaceae bacterium]